MYWFVWIQHGAEKLLSTKICIQLYQLVSVCIHMYTWINGTYMNVLRMYKYVLVCIDLYWAGMS